jgi:hypothetical protein
MPDIIRVGSNRLANNAVTANVIAGGAVTTNAIATGAVTNSKLSEPNAFEDYFLMGSL